MEHRYQTGEIITVGDQVRIGASELGVVVGIIDLGIYASGYAEKDWAAYKSGFLVESKNGGLTLYQSAEMEDIEKIA